MAAITSHGPCEECGSSDAKTTYDNGSSYCFSCKAVTRSEESLNKKPKALEVVIKKESKPFTPLVTVPITRKYRGISAKTFEAYSYFLSEDGNQVANHFDRDGNLVAQKVRYPDKTFAWRGDTKKAVPFGLNKFRSNGLRIIITEGELDCLSVAEATGLKYPVISINNGAQSAKKELAAYMEIINSYKEIVLWFDNDEPGRKAAKEVAELFPPGKVFMINSHPHKDANDALKAGDKAEVMRLYYEIQKYRPDGIVNADTLDRKKLYEIDSKASYMTPFASINTMLKGIRKKEILTFTAGSGIGKSTICREIAYDLAVNKNCKVGYVALEEDQDRSGRGFIGIYLDRPIYLDDVRAEITWDDFDAACDATIGSGNIFLYDHWGSTDSSNLLEKLRYLVVGEGCEFIILDHISIVISGDETISDNERRALDELMTKLRSFVQETGCGMLLVTHLRRPPGGKGFEEGLATSLNHLRGSASIAQLSDAVVGLERNQQGEDPNEATIRVLKSRHIGKTGIAGTVTFNEYTGRMIDSDIQQTAKKETSFANTNYKGVDDF